MMENKPFRAVYRKISRGEYRHGEEVVDIDTGETVVSVWRDDIERGIADDVDLLWTTVEIRREKLPNGYVSHSIITPQGYCFNVYSGKKSRRRGGKRSTVRFDPVRLLELDRDCRDCVVLLSGNLAPTGRVIDFRHNRPLDAEKIFSLWGVSRSKGYQMMGRLREAGVMERRDDGFYIRRDYVSRG